MKHKDTKAQREDSERVTARLSETLYLDNAATSWPKPESVAAAITEYLHTCGASPGRSGHRLALAAERLRFDCRELLAGLLGARYPKRIIFTRGATEALNLAIQGLLPPGAHAVTTGMEHNAVLRPLRAATERGVQVSVVAAEVDGAVDPRKIAAALRSETRLVVVNHASNVCGTILDVRAIAGALRGRGIPLLVDAAQTAGVLPIDLHADGIDLLAFSGHKGLLGPTGIGGLAIRDDFDIERLPPLVRGGTGSRSEDERQPDFLPDKYEAGTPNMIGLAGLAAGLQVVAGRSVGAIRTHEQALAARLTAGLRALPGVEVFGPRDSAHQVAIIAFNIAGRPCSDVAQRLDDDFGVLCRPGLHCAPAAHRTLGTFPGGTLRFSPGIFTSDADVDAAVAAVATLAR